MIFRQKQQVLICAAAGVLVGGFALLRYAPLRQRARQVNHARAAQAQVLAKAMYEAGQLSALKNQLQHLTILVGDYEARVPSHGELGPFVQQLTNLMDKHNLTKEWIVPGRQVEAQTLNCKPVSIQCKGKLDRIFDFFGSLQAMDQLVRIEKIKIENDNDFSGNISMETQAVIYYRTETGQG
jgi:Tfp pilus assembly protein PilO